MYPSVLAPWGMDWFWSLPLIVTTVIVHVIGLMLIFRGFVDVMSGAEFAAASSQCSSSRWLRFHYSRFCSTAAREYLGRIISAPWSSARRPSAMLYSLSAMTTFGHATVYLEDRWELMGALESLDGTLRFGLTTAFLYAMVREVWDFEKTERRKQGIILGDFSPRRKLVQRARPHNGGWRRPDG